jgi:uncharacterized membrane protein
MELLNLTLPPWLVLVTLLAAGDGLVLACMHAHWRRLTRNAPAHAFCGGIVVLGVLWSLQPQLAVPTGTHLLGMAAYTLLVGPALACIGGAIALAIAIAAHDGAWVNCGAAFTITILVPIGATWLVLWCARRLLPAHFLVHVFVDGWLGGALSLVASQTLAVTIASGIAHTPSPLQGGDLVALVACLASGEAMLTGIVVTLFAVAQPQLLAPLAPRTKAQRER